MSGPKVHFQITSTVLCFSENDSAQITLLVTRFPPFFFFKKKKSKMTVGKYLTAKHRAVPSFSVKRSVERTDLVCRTHPFGLLASCERSGTRIGARRRRSPEPLPGQGDFQPDIAPRRRARCQHPAAAPARRQKAVSGLKSPAFSAQSPMHSSASSGDELVHAAWGVRKQLEQ